MTMTESSIDDITQQARQGSVAAIIQVLNERLSDCGVRTRAVLAQGILQLLCEADTMERLERDQLVRRIRSILSGLRPRHIRRVKINSRLVKEQQLLWLEEIQRDPDSQVLWTEEISLPRPNLVQLIVEDFSSAQKREKILATPTQSRQLRDRRQFTRGILGGAGLSVLVLIAGWVAYERISLRTTANTDTPSTSVSLNDTESNTSQAAPRSNPTNSTGSDTGTHGANPTDLSSTDTNPQLDIAELAGDDPFAQAVLIAQEAVTDGQGASTVAEWLELASRWQRASDLMGQIPLSDERYETAQDRQALYQENSEEALKQVNLHQIEQSGES